MAKQRRTLKPKKNVWTEDQIYSVGIDIARAVAFVDSKRCRGDHYIIWIRLPDDRMVTATLSRPKRREDMA